MQDTTRQWMLYNYSNTNRIWTLSDNRQEKFHFANTPNFREQYVDVIVVIVETLYYL